MARRPLQLAAGLLLLVGLLGLTTALIAEVREEVVRESEGSGDAPVREVQRAAGLPVPNLTLLDPVSGRAPEREPVDAGLVFTGPAQLALDPGEGIRPGPVTLAEGGEVTLGPGAQVTGERVACPRGCELATEARELALPPNASLVPPGRATELVDGDAGEGARLELPEGTRLALPPMRFPSGAQLDLRAGARADVPPIPGDLARTPNASSIALPAGTVVHRSPATNASADALADLLARAGPRPDSSRDLSPETPDIEVTRVPDVIEKGQPFRVVGHVAGPDGDRLPDHPVTVYANASKSRPGFRIQTEPTRTDGSGVFRARALVPEDRPTRSYHVLAQAQARPSHDPPLEAAWSDPIVHVAGETELRLSLPDRVGVQVPLALQARLVDAYGAPVPNRTIAFQVEGAGDATSARTDPDGTAIAVLEPGLRLPGNYTIQARFEGTEHVAGDADTQRVRAVEARIEANATHRAPRGEATVLRGRVVTEESRVGRVRVTASYAGNVTAHTPTDRDGRFRLELPVPDHLPPGNHSVLLEAPAVDAGRRTVLTVTAGLRLDAASPGPQPVGGQAPLLVTVRSDNGTPVAGVPVRALHEGASLARERTDASGRARLGVPLTQAGTLALRLEARPEGPYRSAWTDLAVPVGRLDVETDLAIPPGERVNGTARLAVDEAPLTGTRVQLVGPGLVARDETDEEGRARLPLRVPAHAPPGPRQANLSLPAHDLTRPVTVRVLDDPRLDLRVLQEGREGRPVRVAVHAVGDAGPIEGLPVRAEATGAFQARAQGVTAANGTAVLTLHRPGSSEGAATIAVEALPTQDTTRTARVTSTQVTSSPLPWAWMLGGLAVLSLAGAALARRRDAEPEPQPAAAIGPEDGPQLSLAIPPQREGLPPVWHPGESTTLLVGLEDADGAAVPGAEVRVDGPPGSQPVDLDEDGRARVHLPAHSLGEHEYRARFDGDADRGAAETVLELRVVDYREEIDREYRRLRDAAHRTGLVGPDATPRDLADALGPPGDEAVRLFERCDYSPRPVTREDYERFMHARRECDPRDTGS